MNKKHWKEFYKDFAEDRPSSFAEFVANKILTGPVNIVDLGCGNGRDSYYLARNNNVVGVDCATKPEDNGQAVFVKQGLSRFFKKKTEFDCIYARFLLHAIDYDVLEDLWAYLEKQKPGTLFVSETRTIYDKPLMDHKRNLVNPLLLTQKLCFMGYEITYLEQGYNMSQYKGENPHLIRIIAKKV